MNQKALDVAPIPVSIVKSPEELTSLAVEFGAFQTITVPQIGQNTGTLAPVLARRPTRDEAYVFILPQATATAVVLAHRQDYVSNAANPQGGIFPVSATSPIVQVKWKAQQPLYAVGIGAPATIIVLDMAQAASNAQAEEATQVYDIDEANELEGARYGGDSAGNLY